MSKKNHVNAAASSIQQNTRMKAFKSAERKAGVNVVEGHIADSKAKAIADLMQLETKITGSKNAIVSSNLYSGVNCAEQAHKSGISGAKSGTVASGAISARTATALGAIGLGTVAPLTVVGASIHPLGTLLSWLFDD